MEGAAMTSIRTRDAKTGEQIDQLRLLRFVAAFLVLLFHLFSGFAADFGLARNYFQIGAFGVDIFFVLSGFVIAYSAQPAAGPAHFIVRRIARVVPLYWMLTLSIAVLALSAPSLLQATTFKLEYLAKSLAFIPYQRGDGLVQPLLFLGWTLNYEMFFYAIFAATLILPNWRPLYPCLMVVAFVLAGRVFDSDGLFFEFYTIVIMLEFVVGVALFVAWRDRRQWLEFPSAGYAIGFLVLLTMSGQLGHGLVAGLVKALAAGCVVAGMLMVKLPSSRWIGFLLVLGDASYSLYLSHPFVMRIIAKLMGTKFGLLMLPIEAIVSIGACIAVSAGLYFLVELPAKRWVLSLWHGNWQVLRQSRADR
jgi:exopolysaccharide production protein ExoZ